MNKAALIPLFPCPLMICGRQYTFSAAERTFLAGLEMADNTGNSKSCDDRVLDNPELADLRAFVDEQVGVYKKKLLHIPDDNEIYVTQSWLNRSAAGEFHPRHRHQNSVVSGVLFLDENTDGSLPPIRFHRTLEMFPLDFRYDELNEFNASSQEFDPESGMLMLFPSTVEHDVGRNDSGRVRTSLSFNTWARGLVGGKERLTEVRLG